MKRIWIVLIVIGLVAFFVSANLAEVKSLYPVTGLGMQIRTDVKAKKRYTIACIVKNSTNPYMVAQLAGVRKAAQDMGFEAITLAPAKQDSIEEQMRIVEDLLQKKIDALILHPADSNGIVPAVEKAVAMGVPVATIGTPANSNKVLFRTGVDYAETGVVIMQWVAEKMNGEGNLIILEGPPQADNARERLRGITEVLKKYPKIKVVASQPANFQRVAGMQVMENLLQKFTKVKAVIAANDEEALGAIMAIKAAGRQGEGILVAGFDGSEDASWAIKRGQMAVTYNTDPYGSGYCAAAFMVRYLNERAKPAKAFMPFPSAQDKPIIYKATIDDYLKNSAWWKK
jgi:ABC-type sugar transport system substrate-binding protein